MFDNKLNDNATRALWDDDEITVTVTEQDKIWEYAECTSTRPKIKAAEPSDDRRYQLSDPAPALLPDFSTADLDPEDDLTNPDGGEKRNWDRDYDMIEQSLASLKFCEDVDENDLEGSRFAPLFRENPFCYMMKHGTHTASSAENGVRMDAFTCQHCEETYEIVLETEAKTTPKYYSNLFSHIDSRLDFDWTKYHPPPWASSLKNQAALTTCTEPKEGCDCDFCRSRIWRRACKWCGTPM